MNQLIDQDTPAINVQRPTPSPQLVDASSQMSESETEEIQLQSGIRTPARSCTLETVQEVSLPNSPKLSTDAAIEQVTEKLQSALDREASDATIRARPPQPGTEPGSETGSVKTDGKRSAGGATPVLISRQSSSVSTRQAKGKAPGDGPVQNMTVETEVVATKANVGLAPPNAAGSSNTLKSKPSVETIKPKKDKKKTARKQPAVNSATGETSHLLALNHASQYPLSKRSVSSKTFDGVFPPEKSPVKSPRSPRSTAIRMPSLTTGFPLPSPLSLLTKSRPASSKAEVFEQKVASAVDEADDSDSEETFVYDSNPPDGPRGRYHSRTPSATSMMSQAERNAMRSIHSVLQETGPPTIVRKHTKFAAPVVGGDSTTGEEGGGGTGRSNAASSRGTGPGRHAHHIGRWVRNGHTSIIDSEVFNSTRAAKLSTGGNSKTPGGPPSPRNGSSRNLTNGKRPPMAMVNGYDMDDTPGADDERTPLLRTPSSRSSRTQRGRRTQASQRQLESQSYNSRPSYLNRFAACLVVTMMLLVVITGAIGFMFATSQPLTDIELTAIANVIASEPELMFDVTLRAHNPNIVVVTIDDANLEIFAKSIHAGSDSEWWKNPHGPPDPAEGHVPGHGEGEVGISDDADIPDDDSAPNMRLGTITRFDSSLSFEGSFFNKGMSSSTGSMRLALPGNSTAGGSERWNRILQDEFDLIIKGIVKYSLPLSQKVRSASVSGRKTVKPNSANDPNLKPNSTISSRA